MSLMHVCRCLKSNDILCSSPMVDWRSQRMQMGSLTGCRWALTNVCSACKIIYRLYMCIKRLSEYRYALRNVPAHQATQVCETAGRSRR